MMKAFLFLFFTTLSLNLVAQENVYAPIYDAFQNKPNSPSASIISKFQEFKPDLSNGLINISLNLFTLQEGNIVIPINMRFQPGGIKVNDLPSTMGMGWSLEVGGSISQIVNGLDDIMGTEGDLPNIGSYLQPSYQSANPIQSTQINTMSEFFNFDANAISTGNTTKLLERNRFLGKIADGWIDAEADEFMYSFPGLSGSLFYDQPNAKFMDSKINSIEVLGYPVYNPSLVQGWTLRDKNNIVYNFGQEGRYESPLVNNPHAVPSMSPVTTVGYKYPILCDNWPLTQIVDNNANRTINIEYDKVWKYRYFGKSEQVTFGGNIPLQYRSGNVSNMERKGDEFTIKNIIGESAVINFIYDNVLYPNYSTPVLKSITIKNKQNVLIREISFEYLSFAAIKNDGTNENEASIIFLNKVFENDKTDVNKPKILLYQFEYINPTQLPKRFINAQDKYGYFNGIYNNNTLIPIDELIKLNCVNPSLYGVNRIASIQYMLNGMLKKVNYSTGGFSEFFYESNVVNSEQVGGFRVNKVIYNTEQNQTNITKEYSYPEIGAAYVKPRFSYPIYYTNNMYEEGRYSIHNSSLLPLNLNSGSPVYYDEVIEKSNLNSLEGFIKYKYQTPEQLPTDGGISELYLSFQNPKIGNLPSIQNYLLGQTVYDKQNNIIQEISNEFLPIRNLSHSIKNIQCGWASFYGSNNGFTYWPGNDPYSIMQYPHMNMAAIRNEYLIYSDLYLPTVSIDKKFSGQSIIEVKNETEYDPSTGNPIIKRTINSDNSIVEERIKYSNNFTTFSNTDSWNVSLKETSSQLPIESSIYEKGVNESTFKLKKSILYKYYNNRIIEASILKIDAPINDFIEATNISSGFIFDSRYQKDYEVLNFDINGNPKNIATNKEKLFNLYDYSNLYNTARVVGIDNENDFGFTSFEAENKGNWVYSENAITNLVSLSGKKAFLISNSNNLTKSNLNVINDYYITYWTTNNNAFSIDGTISGYPKLLKSKGGWKCFEHKISSKNQVIILGDGYIDEVRIYKVGAIMETYSYTPLIGMSSLCDANNNLSFYEYDNFNRLSIIRDQNNNIIKKICYNYAGQPEDCLSPCPPNSTPIWQNTTDLRCQQGSCGNTGIQEQRQININPCSSATEQWVSIGQNLSTCPIQSCVTVFSNNVNSYTGFTATYSNGTNNYSFAVSANSGLQTMGNIPGGTYTLTIVRTTGQPFYLNFYSGCKISSIAGTSAIFNNVIVSSIKCNTIKIEGMSIE